MVRIKFCGFTNSNDIDIAVNLGVDAFGFVFYPQSRRAVSISEAVTLVSHVPAFATRVGLFVNASSERIRETFQACRLNLVQFHGEETPEFCDGLGFPYIRALRIYKGLDIEFEMAKYSGASGFLLDTYVEGLPGGTGELFDWDLIPRSSQNIILAGGLTPENVRKAIDKLAPWALDVSGGIESKPGRKDPDKMERFVRACRA